MEYTIRIYDPKDERGVVELWTKVFPDEPSWNESQALIRAKMSVQPELFFVCEDNNKIIGTVLAGFDGVRGWVHKVATHPDYRRMGISRELMKTAEHGLASKGCTKLNLQVRQGNDSAAKFYTSMGYATEARVSMGKHLVTGD